MRRLLTRRDGSTLIISILAIAVCSLIVATLYQTLLPQYRSVYQAASWQEALQGAEAGVAYAQKTLDQLALSSPNADAYDWAGAGWEFTDRNYTVNGERTLPASALPALGGQNNIAVSRLAIDIYTRSPTAPNYPWFRIRSTGRADLPGRLVSTDRRDVELRRMKLGAKKLGKDDPHVTRTVEAIVRPRFRFPRAITTAFELRLGDSTDWTVDSFDSEDANKSDPGTAAGGVYPSNPAERQSNAGIASLNPEPSGTLYGPLINGNGAHVAGDVQTAGGDDPATTVHENVSGSSGMDQNRIFDTFDEEIAPIPKPLWSSSAPLPPGKTGFLTGPRSSPKRYIINGNLGAFSVAAAESGAAGYVEILVNGDWIIGNGNKANVVIPPNVYATVYVDGNVEFGNGTINSDRASSQVATHLRVYGVSTFGVPKYTASGNAYQVLAFYGPNYSVMLDGNVTTIGSVVAKSFRVDGGGNGGFHYDEALGKWGDIAGWSVASYFEDVRGSD